jgi:aminoglycoside 2''-phosphotransferase
MPESPDTGELIARVREGFPNLAFCDARLMNRGEDHFVLVLDGEWVIRFPRTEAYRVSFQNELRPLAALGTLTAVPVPNYELISRQRDFGGYRMIQGEALGEDRFAALDTRIQDIIIGQLAQFLSALHSLPAVLLQPSDGGYDRWDAQEPRRYTRRYVNERRALIATAIPPEVLTSVDAFYPEFQTMVSEVRRIPHADLTDEHILFESRGERLAGIIDFGDAAVGDPAFDFSYFWSYGSSVPARIYEQYAFHDDNRLLVQSYWHFVRFNIDSLYDALRDADQTKARVICARLGGRLQRLPSLEQNDSAV